MLGRVKKKKTFIAVNTVVVVVAISFKYRLRAHMQGLWDVLNSDAIRHY